MTSPSRNYHGLHDYSTYTASTVRLPHLLDNVTQKNKLFNYCCFLYRLSSSLVLHPVGPFRCIWDMFIMLLLIYATLEIPFSLSFGQSHTALIISLFIDICLLFDILLNFRTAYFDKYDNLRLVTEKKHICRKYIKTWFIIDLLTCIPFEFLGNTSNSKHTANAAPLIKMLRIFRLIRIIKMLRFFKMLRIFDGMMKQLINREVKVFMKLFKMMFGMLIFAHFAACLWWFVGIKTSSSWIDVQGLRHNDCSTFTKYSYAWYWAVVTLFTTGYGDIVATNTAEQWVCSISILVGTCFFAYFVGTLTVLISEGDKVQSYKIDKLEEASNFCEKKKLPKELAHAVLTHIRYHCTYNYVFDESEVLNLLPSYLQHDVHSHIAKQFLLQLNIFKNEYIELPDFIIGLIAIKAKSISCNQSYKLYDIDDIAKDFYIQRTGKSVMYDVNNQKIQHLSRGSICGEYSAILFKKRKLKVECKTWSEFYAINMDDIKQILDLYYPKSSHSKWRQIKKYVKSSYKKNIKHCVEFDENNGLDYDDEQNPFRQSGSFFSRSEHLLCQNGSRSTVFPHTENSGHLPRKETPKTLLLPESDNELAVDYSDGASKESKSESTTPVHKPRITKFSKFAMRSNSALRHFVVVTHSEKHNKSDKKDLNKRLPIKKWRSEPKLRLVKKQNKEVELTINNVKNVQKNSKDSSTHDEVSSDHDSECSFSSISLSESFDEEHTKEAHSTMTDLHNIQTANGCNANAKKKKVKKAIKIQTKKRSRMKGGTFGGKFKRAAKKYYKSLTPPTTPHYLNPSLTPPKQKISSRTIGTISSFESLPLMNTSDEDEHINNDNPEQMYIDIGDEVLNEIVRNHAKFENGNIPNPLFMQSIKSNAEIDAEDIGNAVKPS